jgi:hypothetical protein
MGLLDDRLFSLVLKQDIYETWKMESIDTLFIASILPKTT